MDAGLLRIARYTEPFALLVAQLAYQSDTRAFERIVTFLGAIGDYILEGPL